MSIAFIASGMTDLNPMVSYAIVCNTFDELVSSLMNWCQVVSITPCHMEMMNFVTLTYKLYEKVYTDVKFTPRDMRLPAPAIMPNQQPQFATVPINQPTNIHPKQQVSKPATMTMMQFSQMGQQNQPNMGMNFGPPIMSVGAHPPSAMMRPGMPQSLPPTMPGTMQPSVAPPRYPSAPPMVPVPVQSMVPEPHAAMQPVSTPEPFSRPGSGSSGGDSDLKISSVTSLNLATVQESSNILLPAQPTKINPASVKSVCTVPPTQLDTKADLADAISLVRTHGKKIPVFKKGTESWVLVEDIQKTYFPRISMQTFVKDVESKSPGVMVAISSEVDAAFRHHYDMMSEENFEVLLMMGFKSLPDIMTQFTSGGTKRSCDEEEDQNPAKKPAGMS